MGKIPVVAVVGPTASGKSTLGIELSKKLNGEVISADSMQIYKKISIATAKPAADEMQGVPHHLIGIIEPEENFSVVQFCALAEDCINQITKRGKVPVIVGGTGLYVDALLNNIAFPDTKTDRLLRENLRLKAQQQGAKALHDELMGVDFETATSIHPNDTGRIIRALELYHTTGEKPSVHTRLSKLQSSPYMPVMIGLNFRNRALLYERIDRRVDEMVEKGLLEEASMFYKTYQSGTSQQAIGYKEFFPYFEGEIKLADALEKLKRETRRYAKRQLTWFRKNEKTRCLFADDYLTQAELTAAALRMIDESNVLRGETEYEKE
ncbi:MAG: tRNA (adenosine(37)-N6)-dimethylallyltransferase MiaA [Clostridiales bacterium]|nr:tRNA (adenosine(37)-N6)-dimethylallyltransferase MiaA [Clostridiales bacterium]